MAVVRENSGSLGINKNKLEETHADRTGSCRINGVDYWINGWVRETDGDPWLSLSFKPKVARAESAALTRPAPVEPDLPF